MHAGQSNTDSNKSFLVLAAGLKGPRRSTTRGGLLNFWATMIRMYLYIYGALATNPRASIERPNYGAYFQPVMETVPTNDYWTHIFQMNVTVETPKKHSYCLMRRGVHVNCLMYNDVMKDINDLRNMTGMQIEKVQKEIQELIPETEVPVGRDKRSLIPFIGQVANTLFGTATEGQLKDVVRHINYMKKMNRQMGKEFHHRAEQMTSYMSVTDKRITASMQAIKENHDFIWNMTKDVMTTMKRDFKVSSQLIKLLANYIKLSAMAGRQLEDIHLGVSLAQQGILTPLLVPHVELQHSLDNIQNVLKVKAPLFELLFDKAIDVYNVAKLKLRRHDGHVYIVMNIPLKAKAAISLTIYKITTIPVPVNEDSGHVTIIKDMPEYIAMTADRSHFLELTAAQVATCDQKKSGYCPSMPTLWTNTHDSCPLSIISQDKKRIKESCNFQVIPIEAKPTIYHLDEKRIILSFIGELTISCSDSQKVEKGCMHCVMSIPCQCSLFTETHYIPPRLTGCINTTSVSKLHTINLAILQEFYSEESLQNITGDSTYLEPLGPKMPKIQVFENKFKRLIASDEASSLSLKRVAQAIREDRRVYESLTDTFLNGDLSIPGNGLTGWNMATIGACIVGAACIACNAYLFTRIRALAAVMILQQMVKPAESRQCITELKNGEWDEYMTMVVVLLGCLFALMLLKKRRYSLSHSVTTLDIEVCNGMDCVSCTVLTVPLCPGHWNCMAGKIQVKVEGTIFPRLLLEGTVTMINVMNGAKLRVPTKISMGWMEATLMRRIIRNNDYFSTLFLGHYGYAYQVDRAIDENSEPDNLTKDKDSDNDEETGCDTIVMSN